MDFSGNILTFDFEFICEYCCGAAAYNKNWMNKFKFEHWIEIKLQLSSQFRLCHLPSSKDFNENKTVARKDELGPGSKPCRWVKCLSGTSLMEKLVIISLIKQSSVSELTPPWWICPGTLHSELREHFIGYFYLDNAWGWGWWGLGHNHGKMSSVFSALLTVSQLPGKFPL